MKKILKTVFTVFVCITAVSAQNQANIKHFHSLFQKKELHERQTTLYKPGKRTSYTWDSAASVWNYSDSARILYNSMASPVLEKKYYSGAISKDTSIYNNSGLLVFICSTYLNGSSWDTSAVETYTYDSEGKMLTNRYYSYSSGSIASGYLDTYIYDNNNILSANVSYNLDNGSWVNSYKASLFYDGNGELNKYVEYTWNLNSWEKMDSIFNFAFDYWSGDINDSRLITYTYADVSGNEYLDSMYYNSNHDEVKYIEYAKQNGSWQCDYMNINSYIYDNNLSILEEISMHYFNGNTGAPNDGYKYVYSDFESYTVSTGITDASGQNNTLGIYPNPNNGTFKVKGETGEASKIEVYNLTGEKIHSIAASELPGSGEISVPAAAKGIYFVKISGNKKVEIEKMIIQ